MTPLLVTPHAAAQEGARRPRAFTTHVRLLGQVDWRAAALRDPGDAAVDVPRARVGLKGVAFRHVEYEVERDFRSPDAPWRDAFVNIPLRRAVEVTAGRFKVPFSREQLTGAAELDFVHRSMLARSLAPGRDTGVMLHGRIAGRRLRYEAAAFRAGGDNVRAAERHDPRHGGVVAGRLRARPWPTSTAAGNLWVGAAVTTGRVPEGEYSARGRTPGATALFPAVLVHGERRRYGIEADWSAGPVRVSAEAARLIDQRIGQGTDEQRLPDLIAQGAHVGGAWLVIGDSRRPQGAGAFEVAARVEDLRMRSGAQGPAVPSPRADVVVPVAGRAWTIGVNWYANRLVRVQADVIRQRREENGAPAAGASRAWSPVVRVQFHL